MARQEKERALLRWIRECRIEPVASRRVVEIGCGFGQNFFEFLRLGFRPENMKGIELLPERASAAREVLPEALEVLCDNALELDFAEASIDIVFQSTVFTSILDADFQAVLAKRMWDWATSGGGILWYDFIYNNPSNRDVRGIPLRRIRQLFPKGTIKHWRLTLAPPISRRITRIHPGLYTLFNAIRPLRTHVLCWIQKT
jgi:SAM-dependent methyltransferase